MDYEKEVGGGGWSTEMQWFIGVPATIVGMVLFYYVVALLFGVVAGGPEPDHYSSEPTTSAPTNNEREAPDRESENDEESNSDEDEGPDFTWPKVLCKRGVKAKLKAPESAEFPWSFHDRDRIGELEDGVYSLPSYVTAKNLMGVKRKVQFSCRFTKNDEGDWTLLEVNMEGK